MKIIAVNVAQTRSFLMCILAVALSMLSACTTVEDGKKDSVTQISPSIPDDGFFVVPGADFSRYRHIILPELRLDSVMGPGNIDRSISDDEKRFFREHFLSAFVHHFIADGNYLTSLDSGREVMIVRASVDRIAPVAADVSGEPHARALQRYQDEITSLTLTIELTDSLSNVLLARLVMTGAIGILREDGNWAANNAQIATVFDQALSILRNQLDTLAIQ